MTACKAQAPDLRELVSLGKVRRWCLQHGLDRAAFRALHGEAQLICMARLLHYVLLEQRCDACLSIEPWGADQRLYLGHGPRLEVPLAGHAPRIYFELLANPSWHEEGQRRELASCGSFLRALGKVLAATDYGEDLPALALDYRNSLCNLILNLALGRTRAAHSCAIEPVCRGHGYYPFPALRIGPSIEEVVAVSNLSPQPVPLLFVRVPGYSFNSTDYADPKLCAAHWSAAAAVAEQCLLPVHPWQFRLSPVIRQMLHSKQISLAPLHVPMMPLASQRTCRVLATGHDLKLSLDATLTGERRLLYRLNSYNAPLVSSLIRQVLRCSEISTLDFQYDVASLYWDDPLIGPHLSAIVRAPCVAASNETVVPALNLWASREQASGWLKLGNRQQALDTFDRYCRLLMGAVVPFCTQWGIALEPHLQNSYVVVRDGLPVRVIVRDLDNSILDPQSVRGMCREQGLALAPDTWAHMPAFAIGQRRLVHALLRGHLYPVMHFFIRHLGLDLPQLEACLSDGWQALAEQAPGAHGKRNVQALRALVESTKHSLSMRLKQSMTMSFQ
ncbi:hypothetical protein J4P02_04355 [Pseudomonas sp. NFXW11]|uniref:IucA/IucC family protein n=1 Tax=Pseudomonas sp. NFXW11 TaxID=2819531 RepID=UPI003CEECBE2